MIIDNSIFISNSGCEVLVLDSGNPNTAVKAKSTGKRTWLFVIIIAISLYIVAGLFLYIFQERLIFYPQPVPNATLKHIHKDHPDAQEVSIIMKDCNEVKGWLVRSKSNPDRLCIYFGGNGDELSSMVDETARYPDWSFVLINYRGYGESKGAPNESKMFSDALQIYDYFNTRQEKTSSPIVVMGRSIGSGVAVYVADNRPVDGVILTTPYDSVLSVVREKVPMYPIDIMLRNRFDSIGRAPDIKQPALFMVAGQDKVIPPRHARRLAARWGGKLRMVEIPDVDHNSIVASDRYWQSIGEFFGQF